MNRRQERAIFARNSDSKKTIDEFKSRIKTGQENPVRYVKQLGIAGTMTPMEKNKI